MPLPQFMLDLGYPKYFSNEQELLNDGWIRVEDLDQIFRVGDLISMITEAGINARIGTTVCEDDTGLLKFKLKQWNGVKSYRFYRHPNAGPDKPRRLPLNAHYSEPLPLP